MNTLCKILNIHTSRTWDVRIAKEVGNINAALLYGQILHHYEHLGEFSKSNDELSKELNLSLNTFRRSRNILINKGLISMINGKNNIPIYSVVKKLDYFNKSYRKYDINYCLINKDNNTGVLLAHLIYINDYFISRGENNFFKINDKLSNELFLSPKELKRSKKILLINGFISTTTGRYGRTYYTLHMDTIKNAISEYGMPKGTTISLSSHPKRDRAGVPKGTAQGCQKGPPNIYNNIYNNINYRAREENQPVNTNCDPGKKEKNKIKNILIEQPTAKPNALTLKKEEIKEMKDPYTMIGIWKEKIKPDEDIIPSPKIINDLQEALTHKFEGSIDIWKDYMDRIASNDYLMGKTNPNWKPKLSWFIQFDIIDKVLTGYFGGDIKKINYSQKPNLIPFTKQEFLDEALNDTESCMIQKARVTIIDLMSKVIHSEGLAYYQSYLRDAKFLISEENDKKILVIKANYGAYNGLLMFHDILGMACMEFDKIIIHSGTNDIRGDSICTGDRLGILDNIFDLWDALMNKKSTDGINTHPETYVVDQRNDWQLKNQAIN